MDARLAAFAAVSLACGVCWPGPGGDARAQPGVDIPQYERVEHRGIVDYLRGIAARPGPVGPAAQKVLDVLVPLTAKEDEIVLPPLVLLSALAGGDVTPDMHWAVVLADRLKAERNTFRRDHEELKKVLIALREAAAAVGDHHTVGFTNDVIADDQGSQEITEPTTILIGDFLRSRLPAQ